MSSRVPSSSYDRCRIFIIGVESSGEDQLSETNWVSVHPHLWWLRPELGRVEHGFKYSSTVACPCHLLIFQTSLSVDIRWCLSESLPKVIKWNSAINRIVKRATMCLDSLISGLSLVFAISQAFMLRKLSPVPVYGCFNQA